MYQNSYTKYFLKVTLTNLGKGVGACSYISKPRQQPLTEASRGVDRTSARTDDVDQFGAKGAAKLVVFIAKQAGVCMTSVPSEERNCFWLARKGLHLLVCALVVKGQSILLRT